MKGRLPQMTDIDFEILNQEKKKTKTGKFVEKYAQLLPCLILFRRQWSSFLKLEL